MDKDNSDIQPSLKHGLKRKHHKSDKKSKKKHKKKHKKRKLSNSSTDSENEKKIRKHKKKKDTKLQKANSTSDNKVSTPEENVADVPLELMSKSKAMAPMTKEDWDKRQSVIRRVYDEESGRHRLIKGDGEVIEEIVSLKRHKEINKTATMGDGAYFQSKISSTIK